VGGALALARGGLARASAKSGTPKAYRDAHGRGATMDVHHKHDACLTIDASYVIIRGLTLRGGGDASRKTRAYAHAITINGGENTVIEDCDVAHWGRLHSDTGFPYDVDVTLGSRTRAVPRPVVHPPKPHH